MESLGRETRMNKGKEEMADGDEEVRKVGVMKEIEGIW